MSTCTYRHIKLGELFYFKNGRAFKKTEWSNIGLPIIRIQNLNKIERSFNFYSGDYKNDILVENGDLLFSWSGTVGSSFGPHIWMRDKGLLNQHIFLVTFKTDINKRYAYFALEKITEEIERQVSGAVGLVHITKEKLKEFCIPIPSLKEQQRIVNLLDKTFKAIDIAKANTEKNFQNARALFESYLNTVFTQRSKDWEEKKLGEVCSYLNRGTSPKYLESGGICVLNQKCIRNHFVNLALSRRHDIKAKKIINERLLQAGDVVVNSTGTGTLGRVAQLRKIPIEPTTVDSHVTIVRPMPDKFFRDFFGYMLLFIEKSIKEAGEGCGGQTELARSALAEKFLINYPIALLDQEQYAIKLDKLNQETQRLESIYQQKLTFLDELKKSILNQAFTGNL